jgi:hypothetical protein
MADNLLTGQPQNIEQIRQEVINKLLASLARIDELNAAEPEDVTLIPPEALVLYNSIPQYFQNETIQLATRDLRDLARDVLTNLLEFVRNSQDLASIQHIQKGVVSHTMDYNRFKTVAEANATQGGDLQSNLQLRQRVAEIAARNLDLSKILDKLVANPANRAFIARFILNLSLAKDFSDENLAKMGKELLEFLKSIESALKPEEAYLVMQEFLVVLKYVGDYATTPFVQDLFSNITSSLANTLYMSVMFAND